jgi:hypothetical protein
LEKFKVGPSMRKHRSFSFVATMVLLLFATTSARAVDSVSVVTTLGGLSANDTIVWSQLGGDATVLPANPSFTSTHGLTGSAALTGPNSLIAVVCPEALCSWNPLSTTGFSAGDSLIWTADTGNSGNGPLTVSITTKNVSGAGAFIQADGPAQFTATIQAFDSGMASLGGPFNVLSDGSGNATFIGILDNTAANIHAVTFSITSCTGDCTDFAIDTVSLNVPAGGPTATPTATATGATATATPTATATATATQTATPTATPTPVAGILKIKPNHKNYGKIKVGRAKIFTFTLSNSAKSGPAITLMSVAVPVTNPQEFGFPPPPFTTCTQQLLPKKKCKLKVEFAPASPGLKSSTLTIFDNATGNPQTVPLTGTGQ